MKASDFHLSQEQIDYLLDRPTGSEELSPTVRELVFDDCPSGVQEPTLVLLGGQPGAGEGSAIAALPRKRAGELVPVSGDDLRPFHDDFEMADPRPPSADVRRHRTGLRRVDPAAGSWWWARLLQDLSEIVHALFGRAAFPPPWCPGKGLDQGGVRALHPPSSVRQGSKRSGGFRQGAPVRVRGRVALMTRRWSTHFSSFASVAEAGRAGPTRCGFGHDGRARSPSPQSDPRSPLTSGNSAQTRPASYTHRWV